MRGRYNFEQRVYCFIAIGTQIWNMIRREGSRMVRIQPLNSTLTYRGGVLHHAKGRALLFHTRDTGGSVPGTNMRISIDIIISECRTCARKSPSVLPIRNGLPTFRASGYSFNANRLGTGQEIQIRSSGATHPCRWIMKRCGTRWGTGACERVVY